MTTQQWPDKEIPAPGADPVTDAPRTYVIMVRPGMTPSVKGPLPDKKLVEDMLRDLYQLHADAQCLVIDMPNTSWPQSGIEWIGMYGDKRRKPIRAARAAVPASEPGDEPDAYLWRSAGPWDICLVPMTEADRAIATKIKPVWFADRPAAPAPVSGMPDLAARLNEIDRHLAKCRFTERHAARQLVYSMLHEVCGSPSPQAPDAKNPTGATK